MSRGRASLEGPQGVRGWVVARMAVGARHPYATAMVADCPSRDSADAREGKRGLLLFIDTQDALSAFCERASRASVLAVDTEFLRERTFFPKLCLLQLGFDDEVAAIDPIALSDLSPVVSLFRNPSITKVIHACSQDLEVLDHALGAVPDPMFDTQVAAAFLGHRTQIGYGALVESYTGVHLAKAESLTDWSRRPLDSEQLTYAEDDVRYLPGIYESMMGELVRSDRLGWVLPEMQALLDPAHYRHEPEAAYLHLRRSTSLTRKQLAVAREVCAWRDRLAARRDIPRKWVLSDEVVLEVCKRSPSGVERLRRIRGTEQLSERDGEALVHAVGRGLSCPSSNLPEQHRRSRPAPETESVVDLMYAMLRIVSDKSGVATQLIATRDDLVDYVTRRDASPLSRGWRAELMGTQLDRLLGGEAGLTVKDGRVEII